MYIETAIEALRDFSNLLATSPQQLRNFTLHIDPTSLSEDRCMELTVRIAIPPMPQGK